jgi:hypothetical protein
MKEGFSGEKKNMFLFLSWFVCLAYGKSALIWLCLERCPSFDFNADMKMLEDHKADLKVISYENWQVDSNGGFQFATHNGVPVSDVGAQLAKAGFTLFPMLTSGMPLHVPFY